MNEAGVGAGYFQCMNFSKKPSCPGLFFGSEETSLFLFSYHCLQDFILDMPFPLALQGFFRGGFVTPPPVISDGPSRRCKRPL